MLEADYKRALVKQVQNAGGQARRYEDKYAVGLLDLGIKLPGLSFFFAEGKIIDGNLFAPTLVQFEEGKKWIAAGVDVLLLGWKNGILYISPWIKQADIRNCYSNPRCKQIIVLREYMNNQKEKPNEPR